MKSRKLATLVLMLVLVIISSNQVVWASELTTKMSLGMGGKYKYNRYVPIYVTIENTGDDFSGIVQVRAGNDSMVYEEAVDVAAGMTKSVCIPVKNMDYSFVTAKVIDQNQKVVSEKKVYTSSSYVLGENDASIGILVEDTNKINYFNGIDFRLNSSFQTKSVELKVEDINEKVQTLDLLDILVLNDFNTSSLMPEQLNAIEKWVEQGGTLIIGTGDSGSKTLSGLKDRLPIEVLDTQKTSVVIGEENLEIDLADVNINSDESSNKKGMYNDLYKVMTRGMGKVIVARFDLAVEPMSNPDKAKIVWKRILTDAAADIKMQEDDIRRGNIIYNIGGIKKDRLPKVTVLLMILLVYIVVMGIVSYFILKKKGKKEYIWIVAPVMSVVATGVFYGISLHSKLVPFVQNQLDIIEVNEDGSASKQSNIILLNTQGRKLEVTESEDVRFSLFGSEENYYYYDETEERDITEHVRYQGEKLSYLQDNCGVYESTVFITEPEYVESPNYATKLVSDGIYYSVDFTNNSDQKIDRLMIMFGENIWDLGEVEAQQQVTKKLDTNGKRFIYDLMSDYRDNEEYSDIGGILQTMWDKSNYYGQGQYATPVYIAINKEEGEAPLLVKENGVTDFYYSVVKGKMQLEIEGEDEVVYPYDYFSPIVEDTKGPGWLEEYSPILSIYEDLEVDLAFDLATDCEINNITLGFNTVVMGQYYYNSLKGEVRIYNYTTEEYETIQITSKGFTIEGEKLKDYMKDNLVRVKVIGQNEESGIVPSIKVGGSNHAKN